MEDKTLTCRDCGMNFTFTIGEQEFFQERGLTNEPRRCPSCRRSRKTERDGGYSGGGGGGGGGGSSYREMYSITCAQCGKEAQVPFQPRQGRPVYCSDCFEAQKSTRF